MSGEAFDPSLVIFAALAVFVIWKLRSVLGVRIDRDAAAPRFEPRPASLRPAPLPGAPPANDVAQATRDESERWLGVAEKGEPAVWAGLDAVAAADPRFDGRSFLDGARRAYEMIVAAFARGDLETLRRLLSADVYNGFAAEIARREERGETVETNVVAIDSAVVDAARATPRANEVTVRFVCRLMRTRRDKSGEPLEDERTQRVEERWTFARDPQADNPNWKLTATQAAG